MKRLSTQTTWWLAAVTSLLSWGAQGGSNEEPFPDLWGNLRISPHHRSLGSLLGTKRWSLDDTFTCPNGYTAALNTQTESYEPCPEKVEIGNLRFWSMMANHVTAKEPYTEEEVEEFEMFAICGLGQGNDLYQLLGMKKLLTGNIDFAYAEFAICEDGNSPGVLMAKSKKYARKLRTKLVENLNNLMNTNCAQEGLLRYKMWELIKDSSVDEENWPVHISAKLLRMVFHDVFDFNNVVDIDGNLPAANGLPVGGGDFCLLTPPDNFGMNFGMQSADNIDQFILSVEKAQLYGHSLIAHLTMADAVFLAAEVGIEQHDGPSIGGYKSGREVGNCAHPICFEDACAENPFFLDMAPSGDTFDQSDNNAVFNKLGFTEQKEIVALLGAHTLGGTNWGITGRGDFCPLLSQPYQHDTDFDNTILADPDVDKTFLGAWFDTTPGAFDVDFFRMLQTMPGPPVNYDEEEESYNDESYDFYYLDSYNFYYSYDLEEELLLPLEGSTEEVPEENESYDFYYLDSYNFYYSYGLEEELLLLLLEGSSEEVPEESDSVVLGSTMIYYYDELMEAMNGLSLVNCLDEVGSQLHDSPKCQLDFLEPFESEEDLSPTAIKDYSMQMWCKFCETNLADEACLPEDQIRDGGRHLSNKVMDGMYQTSRGDYQSKPLVRKVSAFHSDLAMSWDAASRAWVDAFARDQELFFEEFAAVFHKMQGMTHSALTGCSAVACQSAAEEELRCAVAEQVGLNDEDALVFSLCPGVGVGDVCWLREMRGLSLGVFDCGSEKEVECYVEEYPVDF